MAFDMSIKLTTSEISGRRCSSWSCLVFLVFGAIIPVLACGAESTQKAIVPSSTLALNVITALFIVAASIFLLAWLMKRLGGGTFMQNQHMKIVASLAVGTREKLVLVEIDNKKILLGVTPNNISQLYLSAKGSSFSSDVESMVSNTDLGNAESDSVYRSEQAESKASEFTRDNNSVGGIRSTGDFAQFLKKLIKDGSKT